MNCEPSFRRIQGVVFIKFPESLDFGVCKELGKSERLTDVAMLICFPNRSSAVISIGAATLADIFDPAERGKKVGIDRHLCCCFTD